MIELYSSLKSMKYEGMKTVCPILLLPILLYTAYILSCERDTNMQAKMRDMSKLSLFVDFCKCVCLSIQIDKSIPDYI